MSYDHIPNLYQDQTILMFRQVYALEKIHGTSAKISWRDEHLHLHGGGAPGFQDVFDRAALTTAFEALGHSRVSVHGEAYGASVMRMGLVYGPALRFVAFAVKIDELWLNVPNAADVADKLALAFVAFEEVDATVEALDFERDRPSRQAVRNGMGEQKAEGIVIHPLITLRKNNGDRLMAKHKRKEFSERASGQDARGGPGATRRPGRGRDHRAGVGDGPATGARSRPPHCGVRSRARPARHRRRVVGDDRGRVPGGLRGGRQVQSIRPGHQHAGAGALSRASTTTADEGHGR